MKRENASYLDATYHILSDVRKERTRQEQLKSEGKFSYTCADHEMSNGKCLAVLMEEVGEVAKELNESDDVSLEQHMSSLRAELIQVAAVAVAWAEGLMTREGVEP